MKVLKATYEKPRYAYEAEGYAWEFCAETDTDMPHGYSIFGGVLHKTQDGMWEAKCHSAESFNTSAADRLTAIQNCVEDTARLFAEFKRKQKQEEEEEQAERAKAEKAKQENTATILAALRMFQQRYEDKDAIAIRRDWPEHFGGVDPLSTEDIDALCEEINAGNGAIRNAPRPQSGPDLLKFVRLISRMKTEEEFGDDAPPSEDWISTLNDLIAQARELEKKATASD